MGIDKTNYEAYFLDFHEGSLSADQLLELEAFLLENPELRDELNDYEAVSLEGVEKIDNEVLKARLRKKEEFEISELDYLLIGQLEGKLNQKEKTRLEDLKAKDQSIAKEEELYGKTRLVPEAFLFNQKHKLKRKTRLVYLVQYASAAAAAIVLLMLLPLGFAESKYEPRETSQKIDEVYSEEKLQMAETVVILEKEDVVVPDDFPMKKVDLKEPEIQFAQEAKPKVEKVKQGLEPPIAQVSDEFDQLAENNDGQKEEGTQPKQITSSAENSELAEKPKSINRNSSASDEKFLSLEEIAKNKIKKDLLKNKSFGETIADEIAALSKEKVRFKQEKDEAGNTELIAFNIGKFKFSRKK